MRNTQASVKLYSLRLHNKRARSLARSSDAHILRDPDERSQGKHLSSLRVVSKRHNLVSIMSAMP